MVWRCPRTAEDEFELLVDRYMREYKQVVETTEWVSDCGNSFNLDQAPFFLDAVLFLIKDTYSYANEPLQREIIRFLSKYTNSYPHVGDISTSLVINHHESLNLVTRHVRILQSRLDPFWQGPIPPQGNTSNWTKDHTLRGHHSVVTSLVFSSNGQQLVSGSWDHAVRLWNCETQAPIYILEKHFGYVSAVAFSPSGKQVASAGKDGSVRLWDVETGDTIFVLTGYNNVNTVAYSPNGNGIASGDQDGVIRVFDTDTGQLILVSSTDNQEILCLTYSPHGQSITSGGNCLLLIQWSMDRLGTTKQSSLTRIVSHHPLSTPGMHRCYQSRSIFKAPFSYILCSEILYLPKFHRALLKTLTKFADDQSVVLLLWKQRGLGEEHFFDIVCRPSTGWKVQYLERTVLDAEFQDQPYGIAQMTRISTNSPSSSPIDSLP
ncbi:hypothetical protein BGZ47_000671 [Haplosporangium gracile]|nr:hypothetical protein BGZ47_000671 [Haplosporangium gracile]